MDFYDNYDRQSNPKIGEIILYTVKKGDNPYRIGQNFNTDYNWILAMNNLDKNDYIYPNQQLMIPVVYKNQMPGPYPRPMPQPPRPPMMPREMERQDYDMYF